eukprot:gene3767-6655_t
MHFSFQSRSTAFADDEVSFLTSNSTKTLLAIGFITGKIQIKNFFTLETYFEYIGHEHKILSLIFSKDGKNLYSGDNAGEIIQFNLDMRAIIFVGSGKGWVRQLLIFENSLISISDSEVVFWNLLSYELEKTISCQNHGGNCINKNEKELILISYYDMSVVDLETKEMKKKSSLHKFSHKVMSSNRPNIHFVSRRRYGTSSIFEFNMKNSEIRNITDDEKEHSNIYVKGNFLYLVREDGLIRVLDCLNFEELYKIETGEMIKYTWIDEIQNNLTIISLNQIIKEDGENEIDLKFVSVKNILNMKKVLTRGKDFNLNFRFRTPSKFRFPFGK